MKTNVKKIFSKLMFLCMMATVTVLSSCDEHKEFPDTAMKIGHVVCTDGSIRPLSEVKTLGKKPIAVVYYINRNDAAEGLGYAVYLNEVTPVAFADSLGIVQGTSGSLTALDGNQNTFSLFDAKDVHSPLAESVFDLWHDRQSAYIPSVAQMRLLNATKAMVNPVIKECGGTTIPTSSKDCWYWTSTEVEGMQRSKAWLYSLESGAMLETSKLQAHRARPIITLNQ